MRAKNDQLCVFRRFPRFLGKKWIGRAFQPTCALHADRYREFERFSGENWCFYLTMVIGSGKKLLNLLKKEDLMKNYPRISLMALAIMLFSPASPLFASGIAAPGIGGNFSGPVEGNVAAIFWNPAALGQLEGTNVLGTLNLNWLNFTYKSNTDPWTEDPKDYPKVKSSTLGPPPFLGVASDIGLEKLVWGVGFYVPYGGVLDWPEEVTVDGETEPAPQRFGAIEVANMCYTINPAAAYRVLPNLMVGAGLSYNYSTLDADLAFKYKEPEWEFPMEGLPDQRVKISDLELRTNEKDLSASSVGWSFGILWSPLESLDIGLSYISGIKFTLKGDIEVKSDQEVRLIELNGVDQTGGTPVIVDVVLEGNGDVELNPFNLPQMINFGAEYRPTDKIELDFALRWEGWSAREYSNAIISVNVTGTTDIHLTIFEDPLPLDEEIIETERMNWDLKDAFGLRLWGKYRLLENLKLGAGFGWEQGVASPEVTSVENFSTDRITLFGGWQCEVSENFILELSYLHAFYNKLTVEADESKKDPPVSGDFTGKIDMISMGIGYRF